MKNIFESDVTKEVVNRINRLTPDSKGQWGKMNVSQMLAHCNVAYEMVYTDKQPKPNAIKRFLLKTFVKKMVVGDKPFPKNGRTAPAFLITTKKEFEKEKAAILNNINKTHELGAGHFHNKESHSFGKLSKEEWSTMFYKHLDHHLTQFNV